MLNDIEEKELIEKFYFEDIIKIRGKKYYEHNKIEYVKKIENDYDYYALVEGSKDNTYEVYINSYDCQGTCACPYSYECKHMYAVLLAIQNKEYQLIQTKYPTYVSYDINEIIKKIPAHKIKEAILNRSNIFNINLPRFKSEFKNYFPKEKYIHYYNKLYNCIMTNQEYDELIIDYISYIEEYIRDNDYLEAFKIIKSIFEVEKDIENKDFSEVLSYMREPLNKLLQVVSDKSNETIKKQIKEWKKQLI